MELDYSIDATSPATRHLGIRLEFDCSTVATPGGEVVLFLPTWTPGSYLIREYARHLGHVEAFDASNGRSVPCEKVSKNRFRLLPAADVARLRVTYAVYAHELSVRTADLTAEHAYWNHACVLLWPLGRDQMAARLTIRMPAGWEVACSLPVEVAAIDFGRETRVTLRAHDLDEVLDAPCLLGRFRRLDWMVGDVPHSIVLDGLAAVKPADSLVTDLAAIVRTASGVFGGPLPYQRYLFLALFAGEGHGGLEHRDSTTLLMGRTAFRSEKGYREFLSLAAHELFHAWNAKRLRPREFWHYDYEHENYTSLLWLIEGWTAYYDDLICLRAGLFTPEEYLAIVGRNLTAMRNAPGRFRLSLAESSFDAWIRLYRPDENTRNSSQNYYGNGAIAALCLDLSIRRESGGARNLDWVLRDLYEGTFRAGRGYTLADVQEAVERIGGPACRDAMQLWTTGALDPDVGSLLAAFGCRLSSKDVERPFLGITFDAGKTTIASVQLDAPAHAGGLAPGDEILAIDELRIDSDRWQEVFQAVAVIGTPLEVLYARRGVVSRLQVLPTAGPGVASVELDGKATPEQVALRAGWLPRIAKP